MCVPIDTDVSFRSNQVWTIMIFMFRCCFIVYDYLCLSPILCCWQLEDGDIICYQKRCSPEKMDQYRYPSVSSFLEYIHNRQVILFFPRKHRRAALHYIKKIKRG
jgi:hypothetical protein